MLFAAVLRFLQHSLILDELRLVAVECVEVTQGLYIVAQLESVLILAQELKLNSPGTGQSLIVNSACCAAFASVHSQGRSHCKDPTSPLHSKTIKPQSSEPESRASTRLRTTRYTNLNDFRIVVTDRVVVLYAESLEVLDETALKIARVTGLDSSVD